MEETAIIQRKTGMISKKILHTEEQNTQAADKTPALAQTSAWNSVSHKDQLKGSLGASIEILKDPFQILRVPILSCCI